MLYNGIIVYDLSMIASNVKEISKILYPSDEIMIAQLNI